MQPLQCVLQHDVANPHVSTHMAIKHAFHCDLQPQIPKHPTTAYTHKRIQSSLKPQLKRGPKKKTSERPQPHPAHTRAALHRRLQPLYTEKRKVSCSGIIPSTHTYIYIYIYIYLSIDRSIYLSTYHATFMQQLQCVLQHDVANPHVSTHMATKHACYCDLQPQIPKHPITAHTQTHPKQLEATVTVRQKKTVRTIPAAPAAHARAALHRRLQPLYTEKRKVSCSGFLPSTHIYIYIYISCEM